MISRLMSRRDDSRPRWPRALGRAAYWLLVLCVSLVFVFLLLLFFESRDASEVGAASVRSPEQVFTAWRSLPSNPLDEVLAGAHRDAPLDASGSAWTRRAKTTIRLAAL